MARMTGKTEASEQEVVVQFCDLFRIPIVHIPNEGKRSARYGAELGRMGLRKGFPDLFIPKAKKGFYGLFIELKRDRLNRPTLRQKEWIESLNASGYRAVVCYGAEEAIREIKNYYGGNS